MTLRLRSRYMVPVAGLHLCPRLSWQPRSVGAMDGVPIAPPCLLAKPVALTVGTWVPSGVISSMAGWKILYQWRFIARNITYFYGPWLPARHGADETGGEISLMLITLW